MQRHAARNHIVIIGAGASGLLAAVTARRFGAHVTLLEHMETPAKKLLLTGNGRCNYTNTDVSSVHYHGDKSLISSVLSQFGYADTIDFFKSIGVFPKEKKYAYDSSGYVYPASGEASSVRQALLNALTEQGNSPCAEADSARLIPGCDIYSVFRTNSKAENEHSFVIETSKGTFSADAVILATGSNAMPRTGSDSSIYPILKSFSVPFQSFLPALCQIRCKESWLTQIRGVRCEAGLRLMIEGVDMTAEGGGDASFSSYGEIQFNENGISGIPAMQLSRYVAIAYAREKQRLKAGREKKNAQDAVNAESGTGKEDCASGNSPLRISLYVDLFPAYSEERKQAFLLHCIETDGRRFGKLQIARALSGLLPQKLCALLEERAELWASERGKQHTKEAKKAGEASAQPSLGALSRLLAAPLLLHAAGTGDFASAQACSGGILSEALDEKTLMLKNCPGMFAAGELLDVDADCGGYNLQWAWSTGYIAGRAAAGLRLRGLNPETAN